MVYLSGLVKSGFDLTPPVFALSSFLMLFAVFRYDFLDVDTAASRRIFASIAEGIVICNRRGAVTYCNHTAFRRTGAKNGDRYDDILEKFSLKMLKMMRLRFTFPAGISEAEAVHHTRKAGERLPGFW